MIEEADFLKRAPLVAREAVEKVRAPAVEAGRYDLVLDPEHLSLTMHESCGHPSELDRARAQGWEGDADPIGEALRAIYAPPPRERSPEDRAELEKLRGEVSQLLRGLPWTTAKLGCCATS